MGGELGMQVSFFSFTSLLVPCIFYIWFSFSVFFFLGEFAPEMILYLIHLFKLSEAIWMVLSKISAPLSLPYDFVFWALWDIGGALDLLVLSVWFRFCVDLWEKLSLWLSDYLIWFSKFVLLHVQC